MNRTTGAEAPRKGATMKAHEFTYGGAPAGTALPEGVIVGRTLTAYRVETPEGGERFVPFARVHTMTPAEPLVRFA